MFYGIYWLCKFYIRFFINYVIFILYLNIYFCINGYLLIIIIKSYVFVSFNLCRKYDVMIIKEWGYYV